MFQFGEARCFAWRLRPSKPPVATRLTRTQRNKRIQEEAKGSASPNFLTYLVILCFERQCPTKHVARLKSKYLPPHILGWLRCYPDVGNCRKDWLNTEKKCDNSFQYCNKQKYVKEEMLPTHSDLTFGNLFRVESRVQPRLLRYKNWVIFREAVICFKTARMIQK